MAKQKKTEHETADAPSSTTIADGEAPTQREYFWTGRATELARARDAGGPLEALTPEHFERVGRFMRHAMIAEIRHGAGLTKVPEVDVYTYDSGHIHVRLRDGERVIREVTAPVGIAGDVGAVQGDAPADTRTDEERAADAQKDRDELRAFISPAPPPAADSDADELEDATIDPFDDGDGEP